jgi:hypothetical protein
VLDPVVEQNRRLHAAAMASAVVTAQQAQPAAAVSEQQELPLDIAA